MLNYAYVTHHNNGKKRTWLAATHLASLSSEKPICALRQTRLATVWCRHYTCYRPRESIPQRASLSLLPLHHWKSWSKRKQNLCTQGLSISRIFPPSPSGALGETTLIAVPGTRGRNSSFFQMCYCFTNSPWKLIIVVWNVIYVI